MAFALACTRQRLCSKIGHVKFRFSTTTNADKVTILYPQTKFQEMIHIFYREVLYWEYSQIKVMI